MPTIKRKAARPWHPVNEKDHRGNEKFYKTYAWVKDRALRRKLDPMARFCVECIKEGNYIPGPIEDHITPIRQGGDPWNWQNRQSLCHRHHAQKSVKERQNN